MPYVKLDTDTLNSSLWVSDYRTRITFLTMLMLAKPDGMVTAKAPGIARAAVLPIEDVRRALEELESPDPDSRSENKEGRRIERADGGYKIINYLKYRDKDHTHAERQRRYREKKKAESDASQGVTGNEGDASQLSRVTEAEAEAEKTTPPDGGESPAKPPTCPHQRILELWHEVLPELPAIRVWNEQRRRNLSTRWREDKRHQSLDFWRGLFEYIRDSDFLMGRTNGREGRPFKLTMEWLIQPRNFAKVIERHYHDE